ncbi:acylphosphatase [Amylocarpus encephaloides]|uniref:Acylphosphatase n=1 Tax=Amylocarpus encephaloides TaxID=45428 RepID=A0A9P8C3V6_9HELO|nr:acylphosphatase [Amylocarpus encephaloides]
MTTTMLRRHDADERDPRLQSSTSMAKRVFFRVHGEVQGVSFRYFTKRQAIACGLTGWVRNTSSGNVEGEAQGEETGVEGLLKDLDEGPSAAHVVKLEKESMDVVDGETDFVVRR